MQADRTSRPVTHGPYELVVSLLSGAMSIRRKDRDHKRTVAFVESIEQWDRFVVALTDGATEVDAVHAIDRVKVVPFATVQDYQQVLADVLDALDPLSGRVSEQDVQKARNAAGRLLSDEGRAMRRENRR